MSQDHDHHHHNTDNMDEKKLTAAVAINVLLTLAQVVGGILSGSLSLIADALHNFSDAAALGIALFARKISRKPADTLKTFGYKRAETIAAFINLITLVIIGLYLVGEAFWRFYDPQPVVGWAVVGIASLALIVDIVTAFMTYSASKNSLNIQAAFLHNLSDAFASIAVIISGIAIILYEAYWTDTLLTLVIAGFILWQGFTMLPQVIHILMQGTPKDIEINKVIETLESMEQVINVHHVHIWQLDEYKNALEAHIVTDIADLKTIEHLKILIKDCLSKEFAIAHTTLEFEHPSFTQQCQTT